MLIYARCNGRINISMRLREISNDFIHDLSISSTPEPVLQQHGWTLLGSGIDGAVAEKSGWPGVFKVFTRRSAYAGWVQYSIAHRDNPHVPRFMTEREAKKQAGISGGSNDVVIPLGTRFRGVFMERLKPISWNLLMYRYRPEIYSMFLIALASGARAYRRETEELLIKNIAAALKVSTDRIATLKGFAKTPDEWDRLWQHVKREPSQSWLNVARDIVAHGTGSRGSVVLDLDTDNMMIRPADGALVITDPYA